MPLPMPSPLHPPAHAHYQFQPLTAILSINYFNRFLYPPVAASQDNTCCGIIAKGCRFRCTEPAPCPLPRRCRLAEEEANPLMDVVTMNTSSSSLFWIEVNTSAKEVKGW